MLLQRALFYAFLWLSNIPLLSMYHIFLIHSSVAGHLDCFHILIIVNSAAVNIGVHVSFQITAFFEHMPRSGITGSYGNSSKGVVLNEHEALYIAPSFISEQNEEMIKSTSSFSLEEVGPQN